MYSIGMVIGSVLGVMLVMLIAPSEWYLVINLVALVANIWIFKANCRLCNEIDDKLAFMEKEVMK